MRSKSFTLILVVSATALVLLACGGSKGSGSGTTASDTVVNAFEQVKTSLTGVRTSIDGLPTDDPVAFQQAASKLSTSISTSFDAVATSLKNVKVPALDDAFNKDTSCSSVQGT